MLRVMCVCVTVVLAGVMTRIMSVCAWGFLLYTLAHAMVEVDEGSSSAALNYGKWDKLVLEDSDDDAPNKQKEPLLMQGKTYANHEADSVMTEEFIKVMRSRLGKEKYPLSQRKLLARFIAVQHRGDEPSNIYRYADMCAMVAQFSDKLLRRSSTDLLCDLHKEMVKATDSTDKSSPELAGAQTVLEALNALEAITRHGNAPDFFEQVCNPSHSASARDLCEKYERKEFAKMAMMRSMFGDEQYDLLEKAAEESKGGGGGGGGGGSSSIDWELWGAVALAAVSVCATLAGVAFVMTRLFRDGDAEGKAEL